MERGKASTSTLNIAPFELDGATIEIEEYCPDGAIFAKKTLVGKFMTEKLVNRGAVRAITPKAWGEHLEVQVSNLSPNVFMFSFKTVQDAQEVLKRSPWFIMNHLLSLQYWIPEVAVYEIEFSLVPF